ncbi:hypothetical protein MsAg5_16130 [Methanosarcinaceae archaeon Ag5]|uniref:DUF2164 domain-containing protein n=1 Tax=Methanolapillus africanus TaxID=3028297 RepID=A0AAE4MJL2_9EURY|nr:hypothetical protein [Methanosarcinaceae archaeon Ag5]
MKKDEKPILSKEKRSAAAGLIKKYLEENSDAEIGQMQAEFLMDFIADNIGVYFYNQGVADAMTFMAEKTEDLFVLMKDEKLK